MKRGIFVFLFLVTVNILLAQGWQIGILGTPHTSYILNSDDKNAPSTVLKYKNNSPFIPNGFSAGVLFSNSFPDFPSLRYDFQVLASRQQQQYTRDPDTSGLQFDATTKLDFIKIPIHITFSFPQEGSIQGLVFAGPVFSYLYKYNDSWQANAANGKVYKCETADKMMKINNKQYSLSAIPYNPLQVGISAGIGAKGSITKQIAIFGNVNFTYDFTDIENKKVFYSPIDSMEYSQMFWLDRTAKYMYDGTPNNSSRSVSHDLTVGFTVGVTYSLYLNLGVGKKKHRR